MRHRITTLAGTATDITPLEGAAQTSQVDFGTPEGWELLEVLHYEPLEDGRWWVEVLLREKPEADPHLAFAVDYARVAQSAREQEQLTSAVREALPKAVEAWQTYTAARPFAPDRDWMAAVLEAAGCAGPGELDAAMAAYRRAPQPDPQGIRGLLSQALAAVVSWRIVNARTPEEGP